MQENAHVLDHDRANLIRFDYLSRAEWLRARRQFITSTDMAALSGLPAGSPLSIYTEKVRAASEDDLLDAEASDRMVIGRSLQTGIAATYQTLRRKREGIDVSIEHVPDTTLYVHATQRRHATSLDCWQSLDGFPPVPLECKNTGSYPDTPPDIWLVQVQWQMYVTGSPSCTIVAVCGGDTVRWWDIARDDEVIATLRGNADEFLEKYLDPQLPPPSDGSQWSRAAMRKLFPVSEGIEVEMTLEDLDAVMQIESLREQIDGLEEQKAMLEDSLKAKMGTAASAFLPNGYKISWKSFEKAGYYVKPGVVRPFRIVKPKGR